jgi:hypothetical protein
MLIATIFGVLLVPVLFVLIEKIGNRGKKPTTTAPAAPAATGGH